MRILRLLLVGRTSKRHWAAKMANLSLHPLVQRDLLQILEHYTIEGGEKLADKFLLKLSE